MTKTRIPIKCLTCGKTFLVRPYRKLTAKYCSRKCQGVARIGISPPNKGKKGLWSPSKEQRRKISEAVRGNRHPMWKGGSFINTGGYRMVRCPSKFRDMAQRGGRYVLEHRLVMAKRLGRCLKPNEIIHHKDGNKLNNKIDNLEILLFDNRGARYPTKCPKCGYIF